MAATHALITAHCSAGDHVILPHDLYGGTYRLVDKVLRRFGLDVRHGRSDRPRGARAGGRADTTLIWVETPTNPLLNVVDIEAVVARAGRRARGRGQHIRHAGRAAAARAGRRRGGALGHQVPGRPLGRGGRRGGGRRRGAARAGALRPERGRRGAGAVRLLPGSPRPAHAPPAGAAHTRERACRERVPAAAEVCGRALAGLRRDGLVPPPATPPG